MQIDYPRLDHTYFQSTNVLQIASSLIGKVLVSTIDGAYTSGMIVEAEAYRAPDDRACHAYNNRRTPRTEIMYWEGGHAYIYICYGVHHLFNIVTAPKDYAHAVLIRALEPLDGIEIMMQRRKMKSFDAKITRGPGALSVAMGFTAAMTGQILTDQKSLFYVEDRAIDLSKHILKSGVRIGVESAGESALWPWRFYIKNNPFVSAYKS